MFRGRSPIAQTREPLACSERHGGAAPRLYGDLVLVLEPPVKAGISQGRL